MKRFRSLLKKIMTKIQKTVSVMYIWAYSLLHRNGHYETNRVLIVLCGHIGDVLLDAYALMSLAEWFGKQGIESFFTGCESCWKIFQLISGYGEDRYIRTIGSLDANSHPFSSTRKSLQSIKRYEFDKVIVTIPEYDYFSLFIGACVKANEHWCIFGGNKKPKGMHTVLFSFYNKKIMIQPEMHQMQRTKALLHALGHESFQSKIASIPNHYVNKALERSSSGYIAVSVDASNTNRCWPDTKFIDLIYKLLAGTDCSIVLTGKTSSTAKYDEEFAGCDRVRNLIGRTSQSEWMEIIAGSRFLIGCDSGAVHLAASLGIQSFCLTGGWDGHRVMPYAVDIKEESTVSPQTVYRSDVAVIDDLACFNCILMTSKYGGNNAACRKAVLCGLPCLCMQMIEVEDVMDAIREGCSDAITSSSSL